MDDVLGFVIVCLFFLMLYLYNTQERIILNCVCQNIHTPDLPTSGTSESDGFSHTNQEDFTENYVPDQPELSTNHEELTRTILPDHETLMIVEPSRRELNTILDSTLAKLKNALKQKEKKMHDKTESLEEKGSYNFGLNAHFAENSITSKVSSLEQEQEASQACSTDFVESMDQAPKPHIEKLEKRRRIKRRAPQPPVIDSTTNPSEHCNTEGRVSQTEKSDSEMKSSNFPADHPFLKHRLVTHLDADPKLYPPITDPTNPFYEAPEQDHQPAQPPAPVPAPIVKKVLRPSTKLRRAPLPPLELKPRLNSSQETPDVLDNVPNVMMPVSATSLEVLKPDSVDTNTQQDKSVFFKIVHAESLLIAEGSPIDSGKVMEPVFTEFPSRIREDEQSSVSFFPPTEFDPIVEESVAEVLPPSTESTQVSKPVIEEIVENAASATPVSASNDKLELIPNDVSTDIPSPMVDEELAASPLIEEVVENEEATTPVSDSNNERVLTPNELSPQTESPLVDEILPATENDVTTKNDKKSEKSKSKWKIWKATHFPSKKKKSGTESVGLDPPSSETKDESPVEPVEPAFKVTNDHGEQQGDGTPSNPKDENVTESVATKDIPKKTKKKNIFRKMFRKIRSWFRPTSKLSKKSAKKTQHVTA
ncbi:hypothetical protein GHT06_019559 [Daphnia sinensis]|uniref:Uncharacterized protein n=1 Tax=Daphnia sinensis TaxID=1820382 RepID=A0AAD5KLH4_9CRUS|nr:hypothetical protein GHT06_019559 [Daphnia sinensis]